MSLYYTASDHFVLLPAILLALFGCAVLLFDLTALGSPRQRLWLPGLALSGLGFTAVALLRQHMLVAAQGVEISAFRGAMAVDRFALAFNWIFLVAAVLVVLFSHRHLRREGGSDHAGEYLGLVLLAHCGMFFLATSLDLVTLFIGLELMAVCFYVLVGFARDRRSSEAAIKYLLLGAFSSAFLLYGFSLLYGLAGSTRLKDIADAVANQGPGDPVVLLAVVTSAAGALFKVAAVPFHAWAPDAYEGAPTPVTAYLAVGSTAASFAFLARLFVTPLADAREIWDPLLAVIAVATLTIGNLAAVTQSNVKRLLAYSSIGHAGYVLLGLVAGNNTGLNGVAVYLLTYAPMTAGAFLIVAAMRRTARPAAAPLEAVTAASVAASARGRSGATVMEAEPELSSPRLEERASADDAVAATAEPAEDVDDFNGLMHRRPGYAIWMLIFLMSLAGIPPTAGFLGKYYIFLSLIEAGRYVLAVIATLYVAVALYYYFRIVRAMFAGEPDPPVGVAENWGTKVALTAAGVLTVGIGLYPEPFLRLVQIAGMR